MSALAYDSSTALSGPSTDPSDIALFQRIKQTGRILPSGSKSADYAELNRRKSLVNPWYQARCRRFYRIVRGAAYFADHQPLYRLEGILERAEVRIPRSTLGQWSGACGVELSPLAQAMKTALLSRSVLHADETPVPMLKPGLGHTHRAYLWSYGTTQFDSMPLVVYDFAESRGGHHARAFLGAWSGKLVCDDFSGYKALFERGVIEIGCMAHARRKFEELHQNQRSEIAAEALLYYGLLYDVEAEAREQRSSQQPQH